MATNDFPRVTLLSITPNISNTLFTACSKPYGAKITPSIFRRIIKSGHLSVLEHCYVSFNIQCSVRVLGQLTRHRHLSFTCKSARGSVFDTVYNPITDTLEHYEDDREGAKEDKAYRLPQGAVTDIVVSGNFRAWWEYLQKRMCKRAMPEHRKVAIAIYKLLLQECPLVFELLTLNCASCTEASCSFTSKKGR